MTKDCAFVILNFVSARLVIYIIKKKSLINSEEEKYSRGRRGAPAKGVGRVTGARVQIPLSPSKKDSILNKRVESFFGSLSMGELSQPSK